MRVFRTRSKPSRTVPVYFEQRNYSLKTGKYLGGLVYNYPDYVIERKQVISDMAWISDPSHAGKRLNDGLPFLFVENTKIEDSISRGSLIDHRRNAQYEFYILRASESRLAQLCGLQVPLTAPVLPDYAIGDAFRDLQPNFQDAKVDGINIYTVILELADLKKTFTKAAWSLSKTFRDIPEKNLLINFGVLPFFGDLVAIYDIITKLGSYIDKWNQAALNGMTWDKHVYIKYPVPKEYTTPRERKAYLWWWSYFTWYMTTKVSHDTVGRAHLYFKPQPIGESDRTTIYKSALGLDRPVLGVWEAVPFSWAIDYFFHVDRIIGAFDEALPSMFKYEFVDAGYSVKSTQQHDILYECEVGSGISVSQPSFKRRRSGVSYKRQPVNYAAMVDFMSQPPNYQLGWDKGWKQASYLMSVAYLMSTKR